MNNNNFENKQDFLSAVENKILICDGAMGTSLQNLGFTENPDSLNLNKESIKSVIDVHLSFLRAGSDIIQTNTFGSNPVKLKSYGLISDIEKINTNAVAAAREATNTFRKESSDSKDLFIAGDIGPLGKLVEPSGEIKYSEAIDLFSQQIDVLIKNNVDFILIETIMDLHEAMAAVEAVKKIDNDIPIACTLAFNKNGVTLMGNKAEDIGEPLLEAGANLIGANCGVGSDSMVAIAEKVRRANSDAKIFFQPNAGLPVLIDGKTTYKETPEFMSANIKKILQFNPSVVGGCCGSTPVHVSKIAELVL